MTHESNKHVVLHARVVTGKGGGPEKTILNSPRFLANHGIDGICAYLHPPRDPGFTELLRRADDVGARLESISDRGPWDLGVVRRLLDLCRRENVTIWHGHDYKSNALGLLLRRWWPMHLVSTVHGWVNFTKRAWVYYKVDRICLRRFEQIVCVSPDLVERCVASGVPADRCTLIENSIDLASCERSRSRAEAKAAFGVPADRVLIGAVGRLAAEKGFDHLVQAVDQLLSSGRDVQLLVAGDGSERASLESLVRRVGREDRVRFVGHVANPQEFYEALDTFALSSLREGLPNVILEAMANRVPVVGTTVGGMPRILEHEQNGLAIEPARVDDLREALTRLVDDVDLRHRLGDAGRATIEARYSFDQRMDRMVEVYNRLDSKVTTR